MPRQRDRVYRIRKVILSQEYDAFRKIYFGFVSIQEMEPRIRDVTLEDIPEITKIHCEAFVGFFLTLLGRDFLIQYYRLVFHFLKKVFLVIEEGGEIKGFATGFLNASQFYRSFKKNFLRFFFPALKALLKNPKLLLKIIQGVSRVSGASPHSDESSPFACELSSIAVRPSLSGKGMGEALLKAFIDKAKNLGATFIYLTTDAENNDRVNHFYEKMGFVLRRTFHAGGNRHLNEYYLKLT